MVNILFNNPLPDRDRRLTLFGGALLVNAGDPLTRALAAHARSMIEEAFDGVDPRQAQADLPVEDFIAVAGPLKTRFTNDRRTKELVQAVLIGYGCDPDRTFFDVPRLRIVPCGDYLSSGVSYAYRPHRDIWYASPPCQVNWWMPVYPVVPACAMSIFPRYFDQPVANSSGAFDYDDWCRRGRQQAASQIRQDTRNHPVPLGPVDTTLDVRIAGDTGDMLLFSASHLHATAPNESGLTRFSIDFRTVALDDLDDGAAAPNVDGRARGTTLGDFIRASDFVGGGLTAATVSMSADG